MRLSLPVTDQVDLGVEPFGALDAVMQAPSRQVLSGMTILVLLEVLWREEVGLYLVDIPRVVSVGCTHFWALILRLKEPLQVSPRVPPATGSIPCKAFYAEVFWYC